MTAPTSTAQSRTSPPDIVDGRNARDLAELVVNWSTRVLCPQCGQRYEIRSCGPTHAIVKARIGYAQDLLAEAKR